MSRKTQAPSVKFSQALYDRICELIASGKSLRSICDADGMPDRMTFNRWRKMTPELQAQYDQACLDRADAIFDEILEIADDSRLDTLLTEKNGEQMNTEWVARSRLRVDARKWVLARMNRKKFGDNMTLSGDPDAPVQLILNGSDIHG
ncbi:terminase small subunit-like protein [Burkholderia metallica]|uniref:terminase small subunit-like protein n=1 Tax=Burkholderia metallica TaxID=488729 RepID=UPI001CF1EA3F|nr:hypothetical protein [Burkholderia metallica]MCA8018083.1 hypothetical protein [Burkholderia metallica]